MEIFLTNINRLNQIWFCSSAKWPKRALEELDGAGFIHSDKEAIIIDGSVTSHHHSGAEKPLCGVPGEEIPPQVFRLSLAKPGGL